MDKQHKIQEGVVQKKEHLEKNLSTLIIHLIIHQEIKMQKIPVQ